MDSLINAATQIFLRDGYGLASIDKVASQAGVSTRTIYERFKNKAELLSAVVKRLADRTAGEVIGRDLEGLAPAEALTQIAHAIISRARDPDQASLLRIVATEAHRFPGLALQVHQNNKRCLNAPIARYFCGEIKRGTLNLADPALAAALFLQMVFSVLHDPWLLRADGTSVEGDPTAHLQEVVHLFLSGALPRSVQQT